jgi:geranylgeranyl reductase family protein
LSKAEVLVIGAGPAGLLAAREAARRGAEVFVLEEHPEVGHPNHCAGVLSVEGLRRIGVDPSGVFIQHEIRGGRIYSPDGTEITVHGSKTRAYVINRSSFDQKLAEEAVEAGAEIATEHRAMRLIIRGGSVLGAQGLGWETEAQVVIDGEGAAAHLARSLGLAQERQGILSGVNCEVPADVEPHLVEVWLGQGVAPGLFAWVIPLGEGVVRCGLACGRGDPAERLKGFLRQRFSLDGSFPVRRGFVLTGDPIPQTYMNGLLVVGDAAGQTKATTGGGVILGGLCALKAGEIAAKAVEAGDTSANLLASYEEWWRRNLGGEFSSMSKARRLLNGLPDAKLNQLFSAFKQEGMEQVVEDLVEAGDMDLQRAVFIKTLRNSRVLRLLLRVLGHLALSELRGL